jgi:general secretion pathway protein A
MSSTLDALSPSETAAMLRHRWLIAGGKDFPFTDAAIDKLYFYSQGIPRTQVILADNALLAAYLMGQKPIEPELIDQVVADRGLPDTQPELPRVIKKRAAGTVTVARRDAS